VSAPRSGAGFAAPAGGAAAAVAVLLLALGFAAPRLLTPLFAAPRTRPRLQLALALERPG
jgi:hypothetical protein